MEEAAIALCEGSAITDVDPNIAGPGVIIGFMLTGVLTFLASYAALYLQRTSAHRGAVNRFLRPLTPQMAKDPTEFWIRILTAVVLQLSDQQLITGLLLLVCGYVKYWKSSFLGGANNLWTVTDIVCYSSFTHAATLLSLQSYFQRHRRLATSRVVIMYIIYILWLIVAIRILYPHKPKDSEKLPSVAARFWHAATIIEAIGIMWIYLSTYLPVFLSAKAMEIRTLVSRGSHTPQDIDNIRQWAAYHSSGLSELVRPPAGWRRYSPHLPIQRWITRLAVLFCTRYMATTSSWARALLCAVAEVVFPWQMTGVWLALLWAFSLGALIYSLLQGGLGSTWDFGQLLPVFMILLPFQSLATAITDMGDPVGDQ